MSPESKSKIHRRDVYEIRQPAPRGIWCSTCKLEQPGHSDARLQKYLDYNNLANFAAKGAAVASVPARLGRRGEL